MARGPLAGGGALYYADMLADALRARRRVARRRRAAGWTSAAPPAASCARCRRPTPRPSGTAWTPTTGAIAWAREHLPGIDFDVSPQDPPLPFDGRRTSTSSSRSRSGRTTASARRSAGSTRCTGSSRPAATWCSRRTACTRSPTTRRPASARRRSSRQIRRALYRARLLVRAGVRRGGRLGRQAPRVGHRVLHARVARARRAAAWSIEDFAVGQNADNQDMYVLRRR